MCIMQVVSAWTITCGLERALLVGGADGMQDRRKSPISPYRRTRYLGRVREEGSVVLHSLRVRLLEMVRSWLWLISV